MVESDEETVAMEELWSEVIPTAITSPILLRQWLVVFLFRLSVVVHRDKKNLPYIYIYIVHPCLNITVRNYS